jgi:hypothetical protein
MFIQVHIHITCIPSVPYTFPKFEVEPILSFQIGRKREWKLIKTPDAELLQGFNLGKTALSFPLPMRPMIGLS